jgi:TrpR-related protein YerC/YecD
MAKNTTLDRSEALYEAILNIKDAEECRLFFEDLCSPTELKSMEQRFEVAVCLMQNMVYTDVQKKTGTSTATVSRVKRNILENPNASAMKDVIARCGFADRSFFPPEGE